MSWRILLACAVLVSCTTMSSRRESPDPGPRSGLAEDTPLTDLSSADRTTLCMWWTAALGGAGHTTHCSECHGGGCSDWDVTINTVEQCVQFLQTATCSATVKDVENCAFDQEADVCGSPASCTTLDGC